MNTTNPYNIERRGVGLACSRCACVNLTSWRYRKTPSRAERHPAGPARDSNDVFSPRSQPRLKQLVSLFIVYLFYLCYVCSDNLCRFIVDLHILHSAINQCWNCYCCRCLHDSPKWTQTAQMLRGVMINCTLLCLVPTPSLDSLHHLTGLQKH